MQRSTNNGETTRLQSQKPPRKFDLPFGLRPSCLMGLVLVAVIVIGGPILLLSTGIKFPDFSSPSVVRPISVTIQSQGKAYAMETYTGTLSAFVIGTKTDLGFLTTERFLLAEGDVIVGIDLLKQPEVITIVDDKTVRVEIPYPTILHSGLNADRMQYFDGKGWIPPPTEMYNEMARQAEQQILEKAQENGFLQRALDNAILIEKARMFEYAAKNGLSITSVEVIPVGFNTLTPIVPTPLPIP